MRERMAKSHLPPPVPGVPNVLFITLDTLRADHVSAYGYSRATTPNLDRFARQGVLFENAFSNASWTLPSHASMLTGRYPHDHRADWRQPMSADVPTLTELFAGKGYVTAAFAANTSYVSPEWGLGRGFSRFDVYGDSIVDDVVRTVFGRRLALNILPRVGYFDIPGRKRAARLDHEFLKWLDGVDHRPFFALLNFLDAHDPYLTEDPFQSMYSPTPARGDVINFQFQPDKFRRKPKPTTAEVQAEIDAYDGCVTYLDTQLGRLFGELAGAVSSAILLSLCPRTMASRSGITISSVTETRSISRPCTYRWSWPGLAMSPPGGVHRRSSDWTVCLRPSSNSSIPRPDEDRFLAVRSRRPGRRPDRATPRRPAARSCRK
jgi:hypothetical protein